MLGKALDNDQLKELGPPDPIKQMSIFAFVLGDFRALRRDDATWSIGGLAGDILDGEHHDVFSIVQWRALCPNAFVRVLSPLSLL